MVPANDTQARSNIEWVSCHREMCRRNIIEWQDSIFDLPTAQDIWNVLDNILHNEMLVAGYELFRNSGLDSTWKKQDLKITVGIFPSGIYCYSSGWGRPPSQTINAFMKHLAQWEKEHLAEK